MGPPPCASDGAASGGTAAGRWPVLHRHVAPNDDFVWVLFGAAEVSFYAAIAVGNSFAVTWYYSFFLYLLTNLEFFLVIVIFTQYVGSYT